MGVFLKSKTDLMKKTNGKVLISLTLQVLIELMKLLIKTIVEID